MATVKEKKTQKKKKRISKELIYEMRKGSPIYYQDYDLVLAGEKKLEEVMGSSVLQSLLIMFLVKFIQKFLDEKKYLILSNEIGFKFAPKSWYNLDIAIVEKEKLTKIEDKLLTIPPKVVIEVDTKADLRKFRTPQDYFLIKTQDLLDSGVEKVIWIFTKGRKLLVAEKGKRWFITDWNDTVEIFDDISLNLENLLKEEGIEI